MELVQNEHMLDAVLVTYLALLEVKGSKRGVR